MANEKQQTHATNNPKMPYKLTHEELPPNFEIVTVDVGQQYKLNKEIISKFVWVQGVQYWVAKHHSSGIYYTSNSKDPKILNYLNADEPRCRGNIKFADGMGGNPAGKPQGARNRISVKQALEKLNANPAEFLAGIMTGDIHVLKRYGVKDPRNITVAQKIRVSEVLLSKISPNLKPVDLDSDGEQMLGSEGVSTENRPQIQVYIPSMGKQVAIDATEQDIAEIEEVGIEDYLKNHEKENLHYDSEDEEESMVWKLDK